MVGIFGAVTSLVAQSVELVAGWNLIGLTAGGSVADLIAPIAHRVLALFSWDAPGQTFLSFRPAAPRALNTLVQVAPFSGLWLNVSQGPPIAWHLPAAGRALDVDLTAGFNLVMWNGPESPVSDAIASIAAAVLSLFVWDTAATSFLSFSPSAPSIVNTARLLLPGQRVWVNVSRTIVWSQPGPLAGPEPEMSGPPLENVPTIAIATSVATAGQAVVLISTPAGSGSGFIVSDTEILTNAHVVVGFSQVDLVFAGGAVRSGAVTALDLELDVAVVEVVRSPSGPPTARLAKRRATLAINPRLGVGIPVWAVRGRGDQRDRHRGNRLCNPNR